MKLFNTELLANPYNWLIVFLMCTFALYGLALVFPQPEQD